MRHLNSFEEFLKEGIIRRTVIDKERAKNLIIEAERKITSLNENVEKIGVKDENANDYVEYCYDIIMFLIRVQLFSKGYAGSGQGAHEAEVSFARNLNFNEKEVEFLDQLRYFRNGILYYGKRLDAEYATKTIGFMKKVCKKLKENE